MNTKIIQISASRLLKLLNAESELHLLESWGVDNWSGYYDAFREQEVSLEDLEINNCLEIEKLNSGDIFNG